MFIGETDEAMIIHEWYVGLNVDVVEDCPTQALV